MALLRHQGRNVLDGSRFIGFEGDRSEDTHARREGTPDVTLVGLRHRLEPRDQHDRLGCDAVRV
jgi:hypothetical protein